MVTLGVRVHNGASFFRKLRGLFGPTHPGSGVHPSEWVKPGGGKKGKKKSEQLSLKLGITRKERAESLSILRKPIQKVKAVLKVQRSSVQHISRHNMGCNALSDCIHKVYSKKVGQLNAPKKICDPTFDLISDHKVVTKFTDQKKMQPQV